MRKILKFFFQYKMLLNQKWIDIFGPPCIITEVTKMHVECTGWCGT